MKSVVGVSEEITEYIERIHLLTIKPEE